MKNQKANAFGMPYCVRSVSAQCYEDENKQKVLKNVLLNDDGCDLLGRTESWGEDSYNCDINRN